MNNIFSAPVLLVLANLVNIGSCFGPNHSDNEGHQRLYVQMWNVGETCGTNAAPGCRQAAIDYLTNAMTPGYSPGEFAIMSVFGLLDDDGQAVDLSQQHELRGKNYTHLGGACHRSAVSLTFRPGYEVLGKSVGCLDGPDHAAAEDAPPPKPFAVALVNPPKANGMAGGQVRGCPDGFCLVALNAPDGSSITAGSDAVTKVCGKISHVCTVMVGDFNVSPEQTYDDRWTQLIGPGPGGRQKLTQGGQSMHTTWLTNLAAGGSMDIGQGFPLKQYANVTGMREARLSDVLLPCEHPGPWASDGCTV